MSDWGPHDERKHPRDDAGRFRDKDGGWAARVVDRFVSGGHRYTRGRDIEHELDLAQFDRLMPSQHGDPALGVVAARQGFDGLPEVIDRAEMDRRVAAGWHEIWRGVHDFQVDEFESLALLRLGFRAGQRLTDAQVAELFRSGPYFAGRGIFGNGTYTATRRDPALGYIGDWRDEGDPPGLLRMALRPDARVIDFDQAAEEWGVVKRWGSGGSFWTEPGRLAAARGYDAIAVQPRNEAFRDGRIAYYVILNRTAVAVEEAPG